ncbi:MAG: hypothetical protein ACI3UZ_00955 [Oscillospiraceae bacterium]|nr:hypothetical protein [Oscillospiraceae bacterium]
MPEKAGFSLNYDTVSGDFNSELSCTGKNGRYICGDGTGKYYIDTSSGDVYIKGEE